MAYTILVVDDDELVRSSLDVALRMEGYRVNTAESGRSALDMLSREVPDLVVLDLSMPDLDGWETIARLRTTAEIATLPVVALSGDQVDAQRVREAGFNAYVSKGSSLDQFLCTVQTAIEVQAGKQEIWIHSCNGQRCLTSPLHPPVPNSVPNGASSH
jgi:CheY-like chemotaxis protein